MSTAVQRPGLQAVFFDRGAGRSDSNPPPVLTGRLVTNPCGGQRMVANTVPDVYCAKSCEGQARSIAFTQRFGLKEAAIIASKGSDTTAPRSALRRELRRIAVSGGGLLLAGSWVLGQQNNTDLAISWLLPALACWVAVLWRAYRQLHLNCSLDGARFYAHLGHGNLLTLLRGFLIASTAGFLAISQRLDAGLFAYLPAVFYTGAAIGDALDGFLARRQQQITQLGARLDNELDALGLVIAPLLAVLIDKLHASYLLVSVAYYLFQLGMFWRRRRDKPLYPLPPSRLRRQLAGWQMGLVATCLWPPIPGEVTRILGVVFMTPLLLGFVRDWLHVSGRRATPPAAQTP